MTRKRLLIRSFGAITRLILKRSYAADPIFARPETGQSLREREENARTLLEWRARAAKRRLAGWLGPTARIHVNLAKGLINPYTVDHYSYSDKLVEPGQFDFILFLSFEDQTFIKFNLGAQRWMNRYHYRDGCLCFGGVKRPWSNYLNKLSCQVLADLFWLMVLADINTAICKSKLLMLAPSSRDREQQLIGDQTDFERSTSPWLSRTRGSKGTEHGISGEKLFISALCQKFERQISV